MICQYVKSLQAATYQHRYPKTPNELLTSVGGCSIGLGWAGLSFLSSRSGLLAGLVADMP